MSPTPAHTLPAPPAGKADGSLSASADAVVSPLTQEVSPCPLINANSLTTNSSPSNASSPPTSKSSPLNSSPSGSTSCSTHPPPNALAGVPDGVPPETSLMSRRQAPTTPTHLPARPSGLPVCGPEAAPVTSLDNVETNVSAKENLPSSGGNGYIYEAFPGEFDNWAPDEDPSQAFIHSGWTRTRLQIDAAMGRTNMPRTRRQNFRGCGSQAWVFQNQDDPADYRIKASWCHDRFCLICGAQRAAHIAGRVRELLADTRPLFITLTLRNSGQPLTDCLDRLMRGFRLLRQTELWKGRVTGGVAFLEIKRGSGGYGWHPHLHVLALGGFMEQSRLSVLWQSITGDSHIVDIRRVESPTEACNYVCKYASKPMSPSFLHIPDLADEALIALRGRRLVTTFGTWRGQRLASDEPEGPEDELLPVYYVPVCSLSDLQAKARGGEPEAIRILARLGRRKARDVAADGQPPPPS